MEGNEPKRIVVVVDDHLLADALTLAWEREDDLKIVGLAFTGAGGIELACRERPDVVLMDQHLPDISGAEATMALHAQLPGLAVVIVTMDPTDEALLAAIEAGASGFLAKSDGLRPVAEAVRRAAAGEMLIPAVTIARLLAMAQERWRREVARRTLVEQFTARETEILQLMAHGLDTRSMAERLMVSQTTVRTHVATVLGKLDAHSRLAAVVRAGELGLLP
jgi:DNA-binding NarL/FixJ family response regulator